MIFYSTLWYEIIRIKRVAQMVIYIEGAASLLIELEGKHEKNTKDVGIMPGICYASWMFEVFR